MLNEIMNGVTEKLSTLFPGCPIYTDQAPQENMEPYFFVNFLEPKERLIIGRRYFREAEVSVQFFTGNCETIAPYLNSVAELLLDSLEYISLSDKSLLRGTGMRVKPEPGEKKLTFLVNYKMFIVKTETTFDSMEAMEAEIGLGN